MQVNFCGHNLQVNFVVTICRLIFDHNLQANFLVTIYRQTFFGHNLQANLFWSQSAGQFWILVLTCMQLRNPQATAATLTLTNSMNTRTSDQKSCRIDRADDEKSTCNPAFRSFDTLAWPAVMRKAGRPVIVKLHFQRGFDSQSVAKLLFVHHPPIPFRHINLAKIIC